MKRANKSPLPSKEPTSKKARIAVYPRKKTLNPLQHIKKEFCEAYQRFSVDPLQPSPLTHEFSPYEPSITYDKECRELCEDVLVLIGRCLDARSRINASLVCKLWNVSMEKIGYYKSIYSENVRVYTTPEEAPSLEGRSFLITDICGEDTQRDDPDLWRCCTVSMKEVDIDNPHVLTKELGFLKTYFSERSNPHIFSFHDVCRHYEKLSEPPIRIKIVIGYDSPFELPTEYRSASLLFQTHPIVFSRYRSELQALLPFFLHNTLKNNQLQKYLPRVWHPLYTAPQSLIAHPSNVLTLSSSTSLYEYQKDAVSWMLSVEEAIHCGEKLKTSFTLPFRKDGDPRLAARIVVKKSRTGVPLLNLKKSYFADSRDCDDDVKIRYKGGILADHKRMGKTLELLALIASSRESNVFSKFQDTPTLVICSADTLCQWEREMKKFYPHMRYRFLYDRRTHEELSKCNLNTIDVVIVQATFFRDGYYPALMVGGEYKSEKVRTLPANLVDSLIDTERENASRSRPLSVQNRKLVMPTQVHWRRVIIDDAHLMTGKYTKYFLALEADTYWWVSASALDCHKDFLFRFLRIHAAHDDINTDVTVTHPSTNAEKVGEKNTLRWPGYGRSEASSITAQRLLMLRAFYSVMKSLFWRGYTATIPRMTVSYFSLRNYSQAYSKSVSLFFQTIYLPLRPTWDVVGERIIMYNDKERGFAFGGVPGEGITPPDMCLVSPYSRALFCRKYDLDAFQQFIDTLRWCMDSMSLRMTREETNTITVDVHSMSGSLTFEAANAITERLGFTRSQDDSDCFNTVNRRDIPAMIQQLNTLQMKCLAERPTYMYSAPPKLLAQIYPGCRSNSENRENDFLETILHIYGMSVCRKTLTIIRALGVENSRILVFGWKRELLDVVKEILRAINIETDCIGDEEERTSELCHRFNTGDPNMRVLFIGRRSLESSVTLSAATHIIFLDQNDLITPSESKRNYKQCLGYAYGYGHVNSAHVVHFIHGSRDKYNDRFPSSH